MKQGFDQITSNVFFLFVQLWFEAKPQNLSTAVFIAGRFVNVDKDWFFGNVNEIEWSLFLRISIKRTVVNWARTVALFEVTNPIRDVAMRSHDRGKVASLEFEFFIRHLLTSADCCNIDNEAHAWFNTPSNGRLYWTCSTQVSCNEECALEVTSNQIGRKIEDNFGTCAKGV